MRKHKTPCGCTVADLAIVEWCAPCKLEWQTLHDRATREHAAGPDIATPSRCADALMSPAEILVAAQQDTAESL